MSRTKAVLPADTSRPKPAKGTAPSAFSNRQQNFQRVLQARVEKRFELKRLFREKGMTYPAAEIFMRIFKREKLLEVWARPQGHDAFALLKTYSICALAGKVGPKRTEGDGQTPEGFYTIDGFNPTSDFHLSLHIDYPNRSDQILSTSKSLGGAIYIHGGCRTEGCLAVTDDAIKELYWLAVEARDMGQQRIPVHIFPARLTDSALNELTNMFDKRPDLKRFWANLKPTYDYFEANRRVPIVAIEDDGRYRIRREADLTLPVTRVDGPPRITSN